MFFDGELIGSAEKFIAWASEKYEYQDHRPLSFFYALAKEEYKEKLLATKHKFVYFDISMNKDGTGGQVRNIY